MMKKSSKWMAIALSIVLVLSVFAGCAQQGEQGVPGVPGEQGDAGADGKSAYELAVENGYTGSMTDWLLSLVGEAGVDGSDGANGADGRSAYELAVENGYTGTIEQWLESLTGQNGLDGNNGKSAYELALENGFEGSLSQWLESLVGEAGINGTNGADGKSAYELAVENGYEGTLSQWLASLVGEKGDKGDQGVAGDKGDKGDKGDQGEKGDSGVTPLLQINAETNMWEVSYDQGLTWTSLNITATGDKGDKGDQGEKGDTGAAGTGISDIKIEYDGRVTITLTDGSTYTVEVNSTCEHASFSSTITAPTCNQRGYTTYTCDGCGYSYINSYTESTGHHFYNRYCVYCNAEEPFGEAEIDTDWYTGSSNEYTIYNVKELAGLAYLVNVGTTNFSGKTIKLGGNINLNYVEWVPIGTADHPFAGTFNGQNFTISNLKITQSELENYVGLFGYVTGELKDVKLKNATVTTNVTGSYIGIVCGYSTNVLSGISVNGTLSAPNFTYVGGICGYCAKSGDATFTELTNEADITGYSYVGGLFGEMYNLTNYSSYYNVHISQSSNTGRITATGDYAGGLVGYLWYHNNNGGKTTAVYWTYVGNSGDVTTEGNYAGGIAGYAYAEHNESNISVSLNDAHITGNAYVGGLFGKVENIAIQHCYNTGCTVTATGYILDGTTKYAYVGGYAGYGYSISDCDNAVAISYDKAAYYVGGLIGYSTGEASNCKNTAVVNAPNATYVGGICGYCAKTGNATFTKLTNEANVTGYSYVGGLFGAMYNQASISSVYSVYITESSNVGAIKATGDYAGGLAGYLYIDNTNKTGNVYSTDISNRGNVTTSGNYAGGIAGYVYSDGTASYISGATSSANITANAYVGGFCGKAENVTIKDSSNVGSTVTATGYILDGTTKYVYIGGYAGYGYSISDCDNAVAISYDQAAYYVGGLAGYLTDVMSNCTNTGAINAPKATYVGGICGYCAKTRNATFTKLTNEANITGDSYVGGLFGEIYNQTNVDATYTVYISESSNSGTITATGDYVGGLAGYVWCNNNWKSTIIYWTDDANSGNVTTSGNYVGGIAGYIYSDNSSSYSQGTTNTGTVTAGDTAENTGNIFGYAQNVTIKED